MPFFTEEGIMLADRYRDYMYQLTDRALKDIGPRESCRDAEKQLGRLMVSELEPYCERVAVEKFTCSPSAFLGTFPYLIAAYVVAVVVYWFFPLVSAVLAAAALAVLYLEVALYKELVDPLFPKREGENVIGVIKPSGDVEKRVIVSAHLDSAYEFNIWWWFKNASVPVMAMGVLTVLLLLGASIARTVVEWSGSPGTGTYTILGIVCAALTPVIGIFAFFHTYKVVPGAMDDLTGIAVLGGLARYLADSRKEGGFFPARTEVRLLNLSSEEAGLRGAKRYAAAHAEEMKALPTWGLFLDGIYDEQFLMVNRKEISMGTKMDPHLVSLAEEVTREHGWPLHVGVLPVGATDASAFVQEGIRSLSLGCVDTSKLPPHYHTRLDTIDYVRPESLSVSLQLVAEMIERIDLAQ